MSDWSLQAGYGIRFEWGPAGARRLAVGVECLVVVDVLSFTTSLTVAVEAGTRVFPYAWGDETVALFAREVGAEVAVGRRKATAAAPWSLSPAALRRAPFTARLVLPSPNGSAIAAAARGTVVAGSLRNAARVGRWLWERGYGTTGRPVAVIASGERWPDGSLRPALEDLLGAGAIISALRGHADGARRHADGAWRGHGDDMLSPEAAAAAACFDGTADVAAAVVGCSSGRELATGGFAEDVAIATELGACDLVPVLVEGAFTADER